MVKRTYQVILHAFLLTLLVVCCGGVVEAAQRFAATAGEILVKFKPGSSDERERLTRRIASHNFEVTKHYSINDVYLVRTPQSMPYEKAVQDLRALGEVLHAEPNYLAYKLESVPNDPLYSRQWGLHNIRMPQAWDIRQGSRDIALAILDTGIDYTHEDFGASLWVNSAEVCGDGIDDDANGFVDDCVGINAITGSGDPMDDEGHGTHLAGIAGSTGNNLKGGSGVNWAASIMSLKFLGADGTGQLSDQIEAIEYAKAKGARIVNMSFGRYVYSEFEKEAMANASDILFVAAAGNERVNNDVNPLYPASHALSNIISVAGVNESDQLLPYSNYGVNTVHVAAPGLNILSTLPNNAYDSLSGTSASTAFVSGIAALILAGRPGLTPVQLKAQILGTSDVIPGLQGKILSGGRINALRALTENATGPHIFWVTPQKGAIGSQVRIRGMNFGGAPGAVLFAEDVQSQIVIWAPDQIVAEVPEGAVTGPVRVVTLGGTSNGVDFGVTPYPTGTRMMFPHVTREIGRTSFLIVSNPLNEPAIVNIRAVGANGEQTLKTVTLQGREKRVWDSASFGAMGSSFSIECESEGFYGAAVISVTDGPGKVVALPPILTRQLGQTGGVVK